MKINGNEIRPGNVIRHKDSIWVAVKISHVKPGKGGAFAQLENGLRVMVPPFIQVGEKIIINTNDLSYVKRSE